MARHRSHSVAFKRQVAEEFLAGETLHGLAKRHDKPFDSDAADQRHPHFGPAVEAPEPSGAVGAARHPLEAALQAT